MSYPGYQPNPSPMYSPAQPGQSGAYPQVTQPGYPGAMPGYQPAQSTMFNAVGYPPAQSAMPGLGGYPPAHSTISNAGGYPPAQTAMPGVGGYPPAHSAMPSVGVYPPPVGFQPGAEAAMPQIGFQAVPAIHNTGYDPHNTAPQGYPGGPAYTHGQSAPSGYYPPATTHQGQQVIPMAMPMAMQQPTTQYGQYPPTPFNQLYATQPAHPSPMAHQTPNHSHNHPTPLQGGIASAAVVQVKKHVEVDKDKKPTVVPATNFSASADCEALKKAMKGMGTNEKAITSLLSTRTNSQRVIISATYKSMYGKDLMKELKGELRGDYEDLVITLMTPLPDFLANEVYKAIRGAGTQEKTLVQILCSASRMEMADIRDSYQKLHKKSLESAIANDTSGDLKRLLVIVCQASRSENSTPTESQARADADQLYSAGEGTWGTSETTFFTIFGNRSYAELRKIDQCYKQKTGHSLDKAIEKEFSSDVKKGLKTILSVALDKPNYFAEELRKATKGAGTKEKILIRIIATRCEVDLGTIKERFRSRNGKSLEDVLSGETSGDFKKLLLALCGHRG